MVRRRYIAGLIALAVAMRALVAPGFMLSPSSPGDGLMTVVICTSSGLKLMHIDKDGQPVEQPQHAIADEPCSNGPAPVAVAVDLQFDAGLERRVAQVAHRRLVAFARANRHRTFRLARAPPFYG